MNTSIMIQRQFSRGNLAMMGTQCEMAGKIKSKQNTPTERREREREMKTNKNDLCRNIVEEKNSTSRTEVEKSKVPP